MSKANITRQLLLADSRDKGRIIILPWGDTEARKDIVTHAGSHVESMAELGSEAKAPGPVP